MKVLIVDDEPLELKNLEKMIHDIDTYQVIKAENGLEAIDYLKSNKIDLVLLDIQMPGMNGLEVLLEIHLKWPDTIVSIISAFDDFNYAQKAIELGAIGYLLKPFTDEKFNTLFLKMKDAWEEENARHAFVIQSIIERSLFSNSSLSQKNELEILRFVPEVVFIMKCEVKSCEEQTWDVQENLEILKIPRQIDGFTLLLTTKKCVSYVKQQVLQYNLKGSHPVLFGMGENASIKIAHAQALNDFQTRNRSTFIQFMKYLKGNYYKSLMLSDAAKEVHVSPSHLNRLLKKEYSKTFTEILMDFRINKSKELLMKNYNVEVVSDMVGFNSAAYFAVCFKRLTGISPSRYRNGQG